MGNIYTGSNSGKAGLNVKKTDDTVDVFGVSQIQLDSNLTLTNNGNGSVTIQSSGGGGGGGMTSWTIGSTSGANQTVSNGEVVDVVGGTGISGAIGGTRTVTLDLDDTAVSAGSYTNASITVDAQGRLTSASSGTAPATGTGVANQVTFWSGASTIAGDTGLTYVSTPGSRRLKLEDSSNSTMFEVRSTDAGAASAPDIVFVRDSATPAAGDDLGVIVFKGNDDGGAESEYARISGEANAIGAGIESGQLDFRVFNAGSIGSQLRITEAGVFVNIANDASTDFRVDTTSTNDALRVNAANDTITFGVNVLPFNIQQQTTGTAGLTITIDDDGATASPDLKLFHNSATPLANDDLGHIHFQGKNSAAATISYADVYADILDPTDTVEAGRFNFRVRTATNSGNLTDMFVIRGDSNPCVVVNDSARADVDFRVETDNQTSAFFIDASADNATFNVDVGIGTTPSSSLHVSTADNIIAKFLSTDGTAAIELADNATTNNAVLTRVGQTLTLCANGGDVAFGNSIGSYNGAAPTDGQLLIGDTASGLFDKGTLTSTGGTVTITNGAGTINLEAAGGGGGTPAGSNTEIQFNNGGAFGASARFTFNSGTNVLAVGSSLGSTPVNFTQTAGDAAGVSGGEITSNITEISAKFGAGIYQIHEVNGIEVKPLDYQVKTGKTTTQSFGQTQNTISSAGTYDCYPSQGGLIVVDGAAAAIVLNLVLAQDNAIGAYDSTAKPFNGGGQPTSTSDLNGYGTWQIGDQVTVMAGLTLGQTPNITIRSYNSATNGIDGTATSAPTDDPSRTTQINGVNSDTAGGGQQTITTNYTAKTFVLRQDTGVPLGVSWVCIG